MKTLIAATVAFMLVSAGFALDITVSTSEAQAAYPTSVNSQITDQNDATTPQNAGIAIVRSRHFDRCHHDGFNTARAV